MNLSLIEFPPTAGMAITWKELCRAFGATLAGKTGLLEKDISDFFGVRKVFVTHSGTSALYIILKSLKSICKRSTVIIPSYICPLVALAADRAGFKVKVCDINRDNYSFDLDMLEPFCSEEIAAIIPAHLGGFSCQIDRICEIARKFGIFVIEDCAQSMGTEYKGSKTGLWGDFAFFSLARGKGLTTYEGGFIINRGDKYSDVINSQLAQIEGVDRFCEMLRIFELIGYKISYNTFLSWFIFKMPRIYWKARGNIVRAYGEDFTANFPTSRVGEFRKSVAHFSFRRFEDSLGQRIEKAGILKQKLKGAEGVSFIKEFDGSRNTFLFFPVILKDPHIKKIVFNALEQLGLGVSMPYLLPITGYNYLEGIVRQGPCPNAEYLCGHSLALSTNLYLNEEKYDNIVDIIRMTPPAR